MNTNVYLSIYTVTQPGNICGLICADKSREQDLHSTWAAMAEEKMLNRKFPIFNNFDNYDRLNNYETASK